jgi:hypothetical protein
MSPFALIADAIVIEQCATKGPAALKPLKTARGTAKALNAMIPVDEITRNVSGVVDGCDDDGNEK